MRAGLLAAANKKRPKNTPPARHVAAAYTIEHLFSDWQRSPRWSAGGIEKGKRVEKAYAPNTQADYRQKMRVIERHDPELYTAAVDALDETILYGLYEELWEARGNATARGVILTLSSAISWGRKRGKLKLRTNPALRLGMQVPEPRVRFGERQELRALVAAADAFGRPEIGDAIMLGLWTGQRQQDRLALVVHRSELTRGRRVFRQQKTGEIVAILEAPDLEARLAEARRRREKASVVNAHVILDEKQWKPFGRYHYRHLFAQIRKLAVVGLLPHETPDEALKRGTPGENAHAAGAWRLKPCPSLDGFHDQDLRDTAVTWIALGGATIPEIISVTGHTAESATTILKHYLARHPEMADAAIGKMIVRWNDLDDSDGGL